ncbi:HDIG domain-containing metalloprotein [uncultured Tissierella sp.]|uniref:HD family phosphohydrolase n=1 Tax=uncultured Tissierella sp. TaxID=448160 RepID=UPI002805E538|nr:HDIG domain-containing metalloprotein [uncultured Tissierella sp.]MDU5080563.1 HDIG domain-containing protein [Bacillota bacterium]
MDNKKFSITKNRRLYNGLLLVIFTAILFFITIHKLETNKFNLKIGDIAITNIRATKDLEDIYTTEKLKIDAMNKVEPRYRISPSVQMTMKNTIKDFLDTTRDIKAQESISINKKAHLLNEKQELGLSSKEIYIALRMDYKSLNNFENNLMDLINQVMGNGIKETELEYEKENLVKTFESLDMKDEEKQLGLLLMNATIKANEFLDKSETDRRKEEEAKKIETVILKENEIIASQGTTIGERELELIRESGLLKEDNKIPIGVIIGTVMLISLGMSIIVGYIYLFNNEILYNNRLLILLIIILSSIIICKEMYLISPYIMPVATAALLISMLIEPKLGLLVNMFLSFFLGFILRLDASTITMYMISGGIAALIAIKQEQRYNILLNGFIVGAINLLALTSFKLAKGVGGIDSVTTAGYSFLNGIIAAILTLGSLPVWENAFSVLTTLKLLELSNPNQPLLKKLLLEAPGTYHHSILVGNLSEAAAESISANPLLARVASYYHDIGKTIRPYYFAENQFGMENPHNKLQPMQSTTIITSHTIDGMALGKEKKLPKEIIDIIEEHHGNTAVAYFYYKAKELDKDIDISIDAFRYKGRKPQTKEAAIVMLADSSEAAVRSMKDLTKEKIEDMVRKVVQGKLKDEQLDECNVTLKEIEIIIHSFVNVLTGIYHDRIEYPNVEEKSEA